MPDMAAKMSAPRAWHSAAINNRRPTSGTGGTPGKAVLNRRLTHLPVTRTHNHQSVGQHPQPIRLQNVPDPDSMIRWASILASLVTAHPGLAATPGSRCVMGASAAMGAEDVQTVAGTRTKMSSIYRARTKSEPGNVSRSRSTPLVPTVQKLSLPESRYGIEP